MAGVVAEFGAVAQGVGQRRQVGAGVLERGGLPLAVRTLDELVVLVVPPAPRLTVLIGGQDEVVARVRQLYRRAVGVVHAVDVAECVVAELRYPPELVGDPEGEAAAAVPRPAHPTERIDGFGDQPIPIGVVDRFRPQGVDHRGDAVRLVVGDAVVVDAVRTPGARAPGVLVVAVVLEPEAKPVTVGLFGKQVVVVDVAEPVVELVVGGYEVARRVVRKADQRRRAAVLGVRTVHRRDASPGRFYT